MARGSGHLVVTTVSGYNTGTPHQDPVRLSDTALPASIRDKDSAYRDKSVRWLHRKKTTLTRHCVSTGAAYGFRILLFSD